MGDNVEQLIGALNGALGDYLHRTSNGLATRMAFVPGPCGESHPPGKGRAVVLVHGLMSTELVFRMNAAPGRAAGGEKPEDYGTLLARDLGLEPFYVRYNSGRHVSESGEDLDALLEALVASRPDIEELYLLGHSMGGLVIRSASHAARERGDRRWLARTTRAFYLGSPHLGAPLERFGNAVTWLLANIPNPYTRLVADIVNLRSSGVKDLRYANLRREDWEGVDADALLQNRRHPVPLLASVRHHLIASTLVDDPTFAMLFGDALVQLHSATGRAVPEHRSAVFPQEHVRVLPGVHHLGLAHHPEVYAILRGWCEEQAGGRATEATCSAGAG